MRGVISIVAIWLALLGFYLLCAGETTAHELAAGLPLATLGAGFVLVLRRGEQHQLVLSAPWHRVIGAPLTALLPDAWRVGRVLIGAIRQRPAGSVGAICRQPFRHGPETPPEAGRRALVVLGTSVAPNGYVVDVPGDAILLHRLVEVPPRRDREWPL